MKTAEEKRLKLFTEVLTIKLKRPPTTNELRGMLDSYLDYLEADSRTIDLENIQNSFFIDYEA